MAPKYRGNEDDWYDSNQSQKSASKKKSSPSIKTEKRQWLALEEANGTVSAVFPKLCEVKLDSGPRVLCHYKRSEMYFHSEDGGRDRSPVTVGDRVKAQWQPGTANGVVEGLAKRVNQLSRPAPDRDEKRVHVLAANIDRVVIVSSAHLPEFSPGVVDRFLIASLKAGIQPILCVTKVDLVPDSNLGSISHPWQIYKNLGNDFGKEFKLQVFEISTHPNASAQLKENVKTILDACASLRVVFCGHSGVGKTSLLTQMLGMDAGKVGEVNAYTGKGKHTTTSAVMLEGPRGSIWIDTPGIKEFRLPEMEQSELLQYFPEFLALDCTAQGCLHTSTEGSGCQAPRLPRHDSYLRILADFERNK